MLVTFTAPSTYAYKWLDTGSNYAIKSIVDSDQRIKNAVLQLRNTIDLSEVIWSNIIFANNGYNMGNADYTASTNYIAIPPGEYYIRIKEGYRFSCVEQDAGNIGAAADNLLVSTYGKSQTITVTKSYIRLQIVKWTNDAIDESIVFDISDLTDIIETIQVLEKKDRISNIEDTVKIKQDVLTDGSVTDSLLKSSFIKQQQKSFAVSKLELIPSDNINLLSTSSNTAYVRGKNFCANSFGSGDGVTLVSQTASHTDILVSSGLYRAFYMPYQQYPAGMFTASTEIEILSGVVTEQMYLYFDDTAVALTLDQNDNKYKGHISKEILTQNLKRPFIQFSMGNATNELTCRVRIQVESGSYVSFIEDYVGQDVILSPNVASKLDADNYIWIFGNGYNLSYYSDIIYNTTNRVVCWGDSLTAGAGSNILKPVSDINTDTSYPAVLGRLLTNKKQVVNMGVGGETSWMIAARHGAIPVSVLPTTIPSSTNAVRVYLKGKEQDFYYVNGDWTYLKDNLSYNIDTTGVNPCYINGIKGNLSRMLLSVGEPDPETGETVQSSTYAYYFTREEAGDISAFTYPKQLVTFASSEYRNDIQVIWMGQNDAPNHDGQYVLQVGSYNRARAMADHCIANDKRFIVMNAPAGDDLNNAVIDQQYALEFGNHFINIRKYICEFGVDIANSMGAGITLDANDLALVEAGSIPYAFRIDGVHGNYWYYQIVAKAVFEKGNDLGYW